MLTSEEHEVLFSAYAYASVTGSVGSTVDNGKGTVMSWYRYVMPVPQEV